MPSNPLIRKRGKPGRPKGSKDRAPRGSKPVRELLAWRLPRDLTDGEAALASEARAILERALQPGAGYGCNGPRCAAAALLLVILGAHPADAGDLIADVEVKDP